MTKRINRKLTAFLTAIILLSLLSCRSNVTFTDSAAIPAETWKLDNVVTFSPTVSDTSTLHNIFFTIRTGSSYPFRNIWLFVTTTSPSGKRLTDTLQYMLADEKGKWFGRGLGDVRELNLPYRIGIWFPEKGVYNFQVRHGMRNEDLKGVYDLGIRIEKLKKQ